MSVSPMNCSLSVWSGVLRKCRVCDIKLPSGKSKYCDYDCEEYWKSQHRYKLARAIAITLSHLYCGCKTTHPVCQMCMRCQPEFEILGRSLTVDHISPRRGRTASFSCMHHIDNLQVLCGGTKDSCHSIKTRTEDR